eukprot:CAMPEP_0175887088 /NCGR_PEP_ID=MMETSP0107_2-20121207/45980_1 /TAXON_ID=195067 ORGANISM="Goniomonas pacifica, Strain CCMP1869" /NCGR_SAMPLE_ID=MMETSP0107_2 /ASSEMBLY_ACC=CAM_ASM_000203 /LENGTH=73 /DNA_ID=CAMNT_0017207507 /DNA_START=662 /DNA_END=883 /DNA_ORIENTATION=-
MTHGQNNWVATSICRARVDKIIKGETTAWDDEEGLSGLGRGVVVGRGTTDEDGRRRAAQSTLLEITRTNWASE